MAKAKIKKFFKNFILILLALIILASCVGTIATVIGLKKNEKLAKSFTPVEYSESEQLVPIKDENGNWYFETDKDLKILQLTDVHIGGGWMSISRDAKALNAVATLIQTEKPDLVIATGDIAYPVPFQSGTFNNKTSAKLFADLMNTLGVYWTITFGNHDTEAYSYYSRESISDFYSSEEYSKYCIYTAGPEDVDGEGNQVITVKNTLGLTTQALYLLDSHSYIDGDYFGVFWKYDNIHENQIEWYKNWVNKINEDNEKVLSTLDQKVLTQPLDTYTNVKSLAFFHIPITEYKDAWNEFIDNGHSDTDNLTLVYGDVAESKPYVYCGINEDNFFETMVELGSTKGTFCGHDHYNNFSMEYKGIRLTYGYSIDYLAYSGISNNGWQRGCTIITVSPDGSFNNYAENYYQDKYVSENPKETVNMEKPE